MRTSGMLQPRGTAYATHAYSASTLPGLASSSDSSAYGTSPTDQLLHRYFGGKDGDEECNQAAQCVLDMLETEQSPLTVMFKSFLRELNLSPRREGPMQGTKRHRCLETEVPLTLSLEELYTGCRKRFCLERQIQDAAGRRSTVSETLQLVIEAGTRQGSRITIPGMGHYDEEGRSSDLTIIIQQARHGTYQRHDNDLHASIAIPLVTALTGGHLHMQQLDGRMLQLPLQDVVTPGTHIVISGEGMPILGQQHRRGNLHLRLEVVFPIQLDLQQQQRLRLLLCSSEEDL